MALFGYPRAQENDAERAVRAALAIQRALAELNERNARSGAPENPVGGEAKIGQIGGFTSFYWLLSTVLGRSSLRDDAIVHGPCGVNCNLPRR